jgi:hypothetical protein
MSRLGAVGGALTLSSAIGGCRNSPSGTRASDASVLDSGSAADPGNFADGGVAPVTIQQITNPNAPGHVATATPVHFVGVVAMSSKFLVSKSSTGECTWGVFVSAPGITQAAPYTGILALSVGSPATRCRR